jgi:tetratricopeptide (TPR) repeat protein
VGGEVGQELTVSVQHDSQESVVVELHLVASPESAATRAADLAGQAAPEEIGRLRAEGEFDAARARLGEVFEALSELEENDTSARLAVSAWRRANTSLQRFLPSTHADLLATRGNLAVALKGTGEFRAALELQELVLASLRRRLAPEDPALLVAELSLTGTLMAQGELERVTCGQRAHELWERELPTGDADLVGLKVNLSTARHEMGDLVGALELERQLLAARERSLPAEHVDVLGATEPRVHPDLLSTKQNLAGILRELGDLVAARELEEEVLALRARRLPAEDPSLLAVMLNLATTRKELGDLEGAQLLEEQVHEVWQRLLPPDHPDLLGVTHDLAATR